MNVGRTRRLAAYRATGGTARLAVNYTHPSTQIGRRRRKNLAEAPKTCCLVRCRHCFGLPVPTSHCDKFGMQKLTTKRVCRQRIAFVRHPSSMSWFIGGPASPADFTSSIYHASTIIATFDVNCLRGRLTLARWRSPL